MKGINELKNVETPDIHAQIFKYSSTLLLPCAMLGKQGPQRLSIHPRL